MTTSNERFVDVPAEADILMFEIFENRDGREVLIIREREGDGDLRLFVSEARTLLGVLQKIIPHRPGHETKTPQAPIAYVRVRNGEIVQSEIYAPGLPDGQHELWCEPETTAPYSAQEKDSIPTPTCLKCDWYIYPGDTACDRCGTEVKAGARQHGT